MCPQAISYSFHSGQDLHKENVVTELSFDTYLSILNVPSYINQLNKSAHSFWEPTPTLTQLASFPGTPPTMLPAYIKPLPACFGFDEVKYLESKGALSIPDTKLRDKLLKAYVEFVHPYMPLLDLHSFVGVIDGNNRMEQISLLLFQSVMFAAVASVDLRHLKRAGYVTRRDARRDFFNKTRLLYDLDSEADSISLIQSLLLMTYWYETSNDQKDGHHWMGIAASLSYKIGLHRNTDNTVSVEPARRKLCKRIWWSTYMRDRLIALGTLKPAHIKDSDFEMPMLELDDFDLAILPDGPSCISSDCLVMRDIEQQRQLAIMCIAKARLCICASNVLSVQYSGLHDNHGVLNPEGSTRTTTMRGAKRVEPGVDLVQMCDQELHVWKESLAAEAQYATPTWQDVGSGNKSIAVNRSFLHMIYYATLSALYRPQMLPSTDMPPHAIEISCRTVRFAARELTIIADILYNLGLVRYLPTTGIIALLPAIIVHILDIKAPDETRRYASLQGFYQCKQIVTNLRENCVPADHSTTFLEAAIHKAEVTLPPTPDEVKESQNASTSMQGLLNAGRCLHPTDQGADAGHLTPLPDDLIGYPADLCQPVASSTNGEGPVSDNYKVHHRSSYLASTPPPSHETSSRSSCNMGSPYDASDSYALSGEGMKHAAFADGAIIISHSNTDSEPDLDSMIIMDAAEEPFGFLWTT